MHVAGRRGSDRRPDAPPPHWDLRLVSKAALDEFFFATEIASATFFSLRDRRRIVREIGSAARLYERKGWLREPARFHRRPPLVEQVRIDEHRSAFGPFQHLRFESGYEPHPGEPGRKRFLDYQANRTTHIWTMRHSGPHRSWIVCVPGYRMGHPAVDFTGFRARWLYRDLGLNVAIPVMPLHGPRRVGRRGGDGYLSGDFLDTIHAQTQAVWDIRRLIAWLRAEGAPRVGVQGVSLGGYTAALLASLEEDLDCVIAGIPAVDFLRLLRSHTPEILLRIARGMGIRFDRIEQLLRVISPLAQSPRVPLPRRFLYAGVADRLAPPDHALDLWHHWDHPRCEWYQGGHVSFLWERNVRDLLQEALTASGLASPPRRSRSKGRRKGSERRKRRARSGSLVAAAR
jgi:dienelactone hydrolase